MDDVQEENSVEECMTIEEWEGQGEGEETTDSILQPGDSASTCMRHNIIDVLYIY